MRFSRNRLVRLLGMASIIESDGNDFSRSWNWRTQSGINHLLRPVNRSEFGHQGMILEIDEFHGITGNFPGCSRFDIDHSTIDDQRSPAFHVRYSHEFPN